MTSPEQHLAPEPDPRDEADEQAPLSEETPVPDEEAPADKPLMDADVPASPLALEPDETAIPESDRAPGVVRETPLGGKLPREESEAPAESAVRDMPPPEDLAAQPEPETPVAPEEELVPPSAADEPATTPPVGEVPGEEASAAEPAAEEAPAPEAAPEEPPAAAEAAAEEGAAAEEETPAVGLPLPPEPATPEEERPQAAAAIERPEDWGEELSPELAAILFGGASAAEEEDVEVEEGAPPAPPAPAPEEPPAVSAEAPAEAPARPREPAMVTTPAEARGTPISAGQFSAPPPDAPVKGQMRYVRVEEPLRGGKGQRIAEKWEYFGPDYPALEGRLVKRVESEERAYTDGSWKLTFRRDYSEGCDERTVRITSDGEYAERTDRIQRRDASSGKMRRERQHVSLRYAPPLSEEKRGLLGGLFGRGDGPQEEGPKRWRPATDGEERDARQRGGEALKLGLFERP